MTTAEVTVEIDLSEVPTKVLLNELDDREDGLAPTHLHNQVERIYEELRRANIQVPQILRDFIYEQIGRSL